MGTSGLENRSGRDERQGSIPIFSAFLGGTPGQRGRTVNANHGSSILPPPTIKKRPLRTRRPFFVYSLALI